MSREVEIVGGPRDGEVITVPEDAVSWVTPATEGEVMIDLGHGLAPVPMVSVKVLPIERRNGKDVVLWRGEVDG